jgi:hypothetical protein
LLADSFRRACETLKPVFAFVATHLDQATDLAITGFDADVSNKEANELYIQFLGLTYFNQDLAKCCVPGPELETREPFPVSTGSLFFAGRGSSRWF